jgi:hypothetical protein
MYQSGPLPWHSPWHSHDAHRSDHSSRDLRDLGELLHKICTVRGSQFRDYIQCFLGRPALTKFTAIPHYTYLILKMPGAHGVISSKGDVKCAYNCDKESCESANRLTASTELQELKQALAESPLDSIMPKAKTSKRSIQSKDALSKQIPLSTEEPSKVAHIGTTMDPN